MTRWAPGTAEPFPKTLWFGYRQDDRSDAGETELGYCLRGHREKNDRPLDPIVEHALGVPGEGMISEGVAVSRATQGAVRDPLGHWWVDYWPLHLCRLGLRSAGEFPRPSRSGSPTGGCSTACAQRSPAGWLSNTESSAQSAKSDSGVCPCTRPARARGVAPPHFSSGSPSLWRLDYWGGEREQIQGRYWLQYTVTQRGREGRGLLREGYDYEAFSRPSGAIFNFFVVVVFTRFCSLLFTKLRVQDYKYSGHTSVSYFWWWKAFRSCSPSLQIFQVSLAKWQFPIVQRSFHFWGPRGFPSKINEI